MVEQLNAPETGHGPYGVEHSEEDSFYYVTLNGVRTGKSYPIGKTAYRSVRKLNEGWSDGSRDPAEDLPSEAAPGFLEDIPADAPIDDPRRDEDRKAIERSKSAKPAKPPKSDTANARHKRVKHELAKEKARTAHERKAPKVKASAPVSPKARKIAREVAKDIAAEKAAPAALTFSAESFKGTREQWLNAFTDKARVVFKQRGYELPEKIRVSVGFMFRSPKAIGQCWAESASADGHREVFINPTQADSARVADILTHELAHCLFGPEEKHGKNFKAAVTALGLEGKATATVAGDVWREWAFPILAKLGPIPHGAIDPSASGVKKQTTRLLKCECEECGFIFRATAKHVNGKALRCPDLECEGIVKVDGGDEDEGG